MPKDVSHPAGSGRVSFHESPSRLVFLRCPVCPVEVLDPGRFCAWREQADRSLPRPNAVRTVRYAADCCDPRAPRVGVTKELRLQTTTDDLQISIEIEETVTTTAVRFDELGLSEMTLKALERTGYAMPSPVQERLIPAAIEGRDCLGNAPTGTGKTAAFLLPILEKIDDKERLPQALILAPTRELVDQIGREFAKLSHGRWARAVGVVGGESIYNQQRLLSQGCQVVIATPGRLMDLMARKTIRLDKVKVVVLDEADQMLDVGFQPAVEAILEAVPSTRQTLLFSATMPPPLRKLSERYLKDPVDIRLIKDNEDATIPLIRQVYVMVEPDRKFDLLVRLLEREQPERAIIFCRTKHGADRVGTLLRTHGLKADTMHGNLSQAQRNRVLQAFRTGRLKALVATDVVGRGIDVRGVTHVVNFDLPEDPSQYVHRIGRTGRMGDDGTAFSLVLPDQGKLLDQIEKAISRDLEGDQVEGIFSPPRPVHHRPQRGIFMGRRGGGRKPFPPRRGNSGGGQGGGQGGGGGFRGRRDRAPQGAGR
jgi:ATP-dependent RNA helicase DeaD